MAYEPEGDMKGVSSPYPVGWMLKYIDFYKQAETRHPAGIIGILRNYPVMGKFTYYAPYDGELRPIPSMYMLQEQGDKLKAQVSAGKATAKIVLHAIVKPKTGESANVYAVLPGQSANTLIIHSHHDAPFRSGVEDSSGVGMVLGLAKYYSQVPQAERPYTLVFLFTGGHMAGAFTDRDFIAIHSKDILSRTLYDIAIEHISDDYMPPPYQSTGGAQPRGVFISEHPVTVGLYATSVVSAHASRTLLFPTGTPLGVPTDASPFQKAGTSIVSLISGPTWLFDDDDTLDRVARNQLVPLTRMYIDFIARLAATPEFLLRMNLTAFVLGLLIIIFSPLAAMFLAFRKR
jgi:Zn-dependent M28 family amino/carboxypeptidase